MLSYFMNVLEYHREKKRVHKDLTMMLLYPIFASIIAIGINANYLVGFLIFLVLPSLYLSYRYPLYVRKAFLFSLVVFIPVTIITDYSAHISGSWFVVHSVIDPVRFLGVIPFEDFLWGFALVYLIIMFYEGFIDRHLNTSFMHPHTKYLFYFMFIILSLFGFVYFVSPGKLYVDYFYLKLGLVLLAAPVVLTLAKFPALLTKLAISFAFFFYYFLIYEFVALTLDHWVFPDHSQFIGFVSFGQYRFPLEELLFFVMLSSVATLCYFEFFEDDDK